MKRNSLLFAALVLPGTRPDIEIIGFHLVESQEQKRNLEMTATRARVFKGPSLAGLENLVTLMWGQDNPKVPFELRGKAGVLDTEAQDFEIKDEAELINPEAFVFKTRNITYEAKTKTLRTVEKVIGRNEKRKAGAPELTMSGLGLFVDIDRNLFEIKDNVVAEQVINPQNRLKIRSHSSVVLPQKREASFLGKVTVTGPNINLAGERLIIEFEDDKPRRLKLDSPSPQAAPSPKKISADFEKMKLKSNGLILHFDNAGDLEKSEAIGEVAADGADGMKIQAERLTSDKFQGKDRVLMQGKVQLTVDKRVATCEQAQYFPDSGEVLLERVASVQRGTEVLEGDRIRFSTKHSQVHVEGARGKISRESLKP